MTAFLTLLAACSPLMTAVAAVLEGAALVLAVWTPLSVVSMLLIGPMLWRRR